MRNEFQYAVDSFEALLSELTPYKESSPDLFKWAQESYAESKKLLDKLSTAAAAASQQSEAPRPITGTWADAAGAFANRVVRTRDIEIANSSAGGFVVLFVRQPIVQGINYLLSGNVSATSTGISGQLTIGFYLSLTGGNEACSKRVSLDLQRSGSDLLVGTATFGSTSDAGVQSEAFRVVCVGLPSGTRSVRLHRTP